MFLATEIAPPTPSIRYQQPQIASNGQHFGIVFGSKNTIYFSLDGAAPVVVSEAPVLSLGNHRGPHVAFTASSIVVTSGVGPEGKEYGPNTLRSWRSTDRGKTWQSGPNVSSPGTGGMGFQAIGSDGRKRLVAAWIGAMDGGPRLFTAHSDDEGLTWSKQEILSRTVCECCHPNVSISADGTVRIMFRNSVDGNRDMFLATSKDGEHFEFSKLAVNSWQLNACPMDGGGLGEADGDIIAFWRREGELFQSRPGGQPETRIGSGRNPTVALRKEGIYAVWSTAEGLMAISPGKKPHLLASSGAYPQLTPRGPVIAVWEDNGKIVTSRLSE